MDAGINFRRASKLSRPASQKHRREIVIAEWAQKREPALKQIKGGDLWRRYSTEQWPFQLYADCLGTHFI
jgi:hypothetical protein